MSHYPDEAHLDMQFKQLDDALFYMPFDSDAEDDARDESPSTETGAIIYPAHVTPKVGGCVQLAEATTNRITNPSIEVDLTGWSTLGSGGTGARDTSQAKVGLASLKVVTSGSTYGKQISATLNPGATYTISGWIYMPSYSNGTLSLDLYESGIIDTSGIQISAANSGFVFFEETVTYPGGGSGTALIRFYGDGTPTFTVYLDAVQLEEIAYPTPYCDGSLGAGHTWSGTAHASTSSRTATDLRYIENLPSNFTIALGFQPKRPESECAAYERIFEWYGDANNLLFLLVSSPSDNVYVAYKANGTETAFNFAADQWARETPIHYVITFDGTDVTIYQNGVEVTSGPPTVATFITTPSTFHIGAGSGSLHANGFYDENIVLDYALTANEAKNLYYEWFDGRAFDGIWTDVIDDVLVAGNVGWRYGFFGMMPTDRTAGAGMMDFLLNNSENNSAGLLGYYSVGHTNAREGFELGIKSRLWYMEGSDRYYKFIGKLTKATPLPGKKRKRKVDCSIEDWLGAASKHKMDLLDVEEAIRSDVAFQTIVENLDTQPEAVSYGVGQETFAYWGDDLKDERTTGLAALDRVNISEFGYSFIRGGATPGELVFQNRHARVKDTTIQKTFIEDDLSDMKVRREQRDIRNRVEATVYPREVGSSDENLYSLQTPLLINAGQKKTIRARYTDPNNRDVRLSGLQLNDPEGLNALVDQVGADARGFEGGTGSWQVVGTIAQSSTQAKIGTYSLKLTSGTGAANQYYAANLPATGFAQNDVVYYQVYVYVEEAWPQGKIYVDMNERNVGGSLVQTNLAEVTSISGWVRVSGQYTVTNASTDRLRIEIGQTPNAGNADFSGGAVDLYIDEVYLIHDTLINFEFSTSDTGGGDKDDDLVLIESLLGGNMSELVLENVSAVDGYATVLKVRGRAVRRYDPVMQYAENEESAEDHYKRIQTLQLKYQDDPLVGQDWANKVLGDRELPETVLESFLVNAAKSAGNLTAVLDLEPGERIDISESVAAVDDEYFINGIQYMMQATDQGVAIAAIYFVVLAGVEAYWLLGIVGSSELGQTTWLGF